MERKELTNIDKNTKVIIVACILISAAIFFYYYMQELKSPEGLPVLGEDVVKEELGENMEDIASEDGEDEKVEEMVTTEEAVEVEEPVTSDEVTVDTEQVPKLQIPMLPEGELLAPFNNVLMIGDSRTEGFKLYSGVKNAAYFCLKGINVKSINDGQRANVNGASLTVYQVLENNTFDKVVICIGMNELGWSSIDSFITEYGKLIDSVKSRQPQAQILLHAVLPVSQEKDARDSVYNNNQVAWFNENIMRLATAKGARFVNPSAVLVDDQGFLLDDSTHDGIHLNSQYCKVWANYLAKLI